MIQTLKITDIVAKWRDALAASQEIQDFCQAKYGRAPQIRVGLNKKDQPKASDCPLIIIRPGAKIEGEDEEVFAYRISVGWAIVNETETVIGNIRELPGIEECDSLGQLIYQTLAAVNPSYPVSSLDYELEVVEFFPQFVGEMQLEIAIQPAIGGTLSY